MFKTMMSTAVLAASVFSASAYANTTAAPFVDVIDSVEFNGWNKLVAPLTAAQLAAGYTANVADSSDAVLTRIAGSAYPAGAGLYQWQGTESTFTLSDNTIAAGLSSVVLQSHSAPGGTGTGVYGVSLTYTIGGVDYLAALVDTNVASAEYKYFSWDLSSYTGIEAISVQFSTEVHANSFAFQLDQVVAAVPEPSEYALLLGGLALVGFAARRKQAA